MKRRLPLSLLYCLLSLNNAFLAIPGAHQFQTLLQSAKSFVPVDEVTANCSILNKTVSTRRGWIFRRKKTIETLHFDYNVTRLDMGHSSDRTRVILLVHPIGVGISKWYYDRLFEHLATKLQAATAGRTLILAPDLLACGSAANPTPAQHKLPLFNINDWSQQMLQLMDQIENDETLSESCIDWCLVSNGGCVPIALETGAQYRARSTFNNTLTHIVLSATPRLPGLLREAPSRRKVEKSYNTLSGPIGSIFWYYALRNSGAFIRKFTSRTLLANASETMGDEWTPTCVATAQIPNTKYSAFAFLAGALQHDCRPAFTLLQQDMNNSVQVDVISTPNLRKGKSARSWFWDKKRRQKQQFSNASQETLAQYLARSGIGGREITVQGRICPAYEDAEGYVNALLTFLKHEPAGSY